MGIIRKISFNESLHRYTDEEDLVYTSVTTVIGKYHEQFNEDYWAKEKAFDKSPNNPYKGMSIDAIKKQWKEKRDFACDRGNKTHKLLEDSINEANGNASFEFEPTKTRIGTGKGLIKITKTELYILAETPLAKKYPKIYAHLRKYIEEGWTLFAEKRIYWFDFLIAGTIDCLLVKGKFFMIVDWKTNNKKLEFRAGYYKKVNGLVTSQWVDKNEFFYPPLNTIPFCKGNIYTIQLSLYALLMELWGFKCVALTLFHILEDEPQPPINILYRKQDCLNLSMDFLASLSNPKILKSTNNQGNKFGIF